MTSHRIVSHHMTSYEHPSQTHRKEKGETHQGSMETSCHDLPLCRVALSPIHAVVLSPLVHPVAVHVVVLGPTSTHVVSVVLGHDNCTTSPVTGVGGPVRCTLSESCRGGHASGMQGGAAGVGAGDHAPNIHCNKSAL